MDAGIKAKVTETLKKTGALSSGDMADFSQPEPATAAPAKEPGAIDKVAPATVEDPLVSAGKSDSSADALADASGGASEGYSFGIDRLEEVEVTSDDKRAFEDAIVLDGRFKRPFSLVNGKIKGVFRSRTAEESRSLLNELNRQWTLASRTSPIPASEYASTLRAALLICQIDELQGVKYPELQEPLMAVMGEQQRTGEKAVIAPRWYGDMFTVFGKMGDGKQAALYEALCKFEQKYWTLVKHADDQNFWCPEESTSA